MSPHSIFAWVCSRAHEARVLLRVRVFSRCGSFNMQRWKQSNGFPWWRRHRVCSRKNSWALTHYSYIDCLYSSTKSSTRKSNTILRFREYRTYISTRRETETTITSDAAAVEQKKPTYCCTDYHCSTNYQTTSNKQVSEPLNIRCVRTCLLGNNRLGTSKSGTLDAMVCYTIAISLGLSRKNSDLSVIGMMIFTFYLLFLFVLFFLSWSRNYLLVQFL